MPHVVEMTRFEGRYAGHDVEAWLCPRDVSKSGQGAALDRWHLTIPGQALWTRFVLIAQHFRPVEGLPEAKKEHPAHTHEIAVFAISPDLPKSRWQAGAIALMSPANHVVGFTLTPDTLGDDGCNWLAAKCAEGFVRGMNCIEPSGIMGARERFTEYVRYHAEKWLEQYGPKPSLPPVFPPRDPFDPTA